MSEKSTNLFYPELKQKTHVLVAILLLKMQKNVASYLLYNITL